MAYFFKGNRCEIQIPREPTVQQTRSQFHLQKMTQVTGKIKDIIIGTSSA